MLCLSRKIGQDIYIPQYGITIRLVDIKSYNAAKIGIEAPKDVNIYRRELYDATCREESKPRAIRPLCEGAD